VWRSAHESIVSVSAAGLVTAQAAGGPVLITAESGGQSAVAQITVRSAQPVSEAVGAMFAQLGATIASALLENQAALPRNPGLTAQIQAKIALLQRPSLATEIIDGRFYEETSAPSSNQRTLPIVSVFPLVALRNEARSATEHVARTFPQLEQFLAAPFPTGAISIRQGFVIGSSGGGGRLNMEDQTTYEARTPADRLPYHAIISHEVAHSYFGNESLTQFLELYAYNMIATGSPEIGDWIFTRTWVAQQPGNTGVHALLDIYQLIGPAAMANAYRAVRPLSPRYGVPLTAEMRQAFIDAAPASARQLVAAKIATITF
jgi:hypothetical protein